MHAFDNRSTRFTYWLNPMFCFSIGAINVNTRPVDNAKTAYYSNSAMLAARLPYMM